MSRESDGNVGLESDSKIDFEDAIGSTSNAKVNEIMTNRRSFHKEARGEIANEEGHDAGAVAHMDY